MNDYSTKAIQSRIGQAFSDEGESLSFLIEEVEKSIFSRIKMCVEADEVVKLHYVLKGLKEVESAIQNCINEYLDDQED